MKRAAETRASASVSKKPPAPRPEWAYFFDVDGTLARIAPTPKEARLEREVLELIEQLHRDTGGALALISGRSIEDVDSMLHGSRLPVAGQHGSERRASGGRFTSLRFPTKKLSRPRARLNEIVARYPGLLLEDKGLSLAVHYRKSPTLGSYVHRVMRELQAEIGADYTVQTGKKIVEIRPQGKDKGEAVRDFMGERPFRGRLPVFVGDDVTDESAFAVVNSLGGLSIKVGRGRSIARWRLGSVDAVRSWLARAGDDASSANRSVKLKAN